MKKLLLICLVSFSFSSNAQSLISEDCSFLTIGNVGTDLTGTTPGQGDWLTFTSATATPAPQLSDYQVVDKGSSYGNAFQIVGPSATTGSRFLYKDLVTLWAGRTVGNEIIEVECDVFTGPASTSRNSFLIYLYSDEATPKVIAGMGIAKNATIGTAVYSNLVRGFAYFTNTAVPPQTGLFSFGLAPTTPFQLSSTNDTWVKLAFSFNKTTGQVIWKGPAGIIPAAQVIGAAAGLNPGEIDFINATGSTTAIPNASSATTAYDNIKVRASATDTLLGVNAILPEDSFMVFPNPMNNSLNIKSSNQLQNIQFMDVNGRTVKTIQLSNTNSVEINTSDLSSGIYMMKISSDKGIVTKKVIKN